MLVLDRHCGVLLDLRLVSMWCRGGQVRCDSPDDRSVAVAVPFAGQGFRACALFLVAVYGPVFGAAFDQDRRTMMDKMFISLGRPPAHSVKVMGGEFNVNAEISYGGVTICPWPTDQSGSSVG